MDRERKHQLSLFRLLISLDKKKACTILKLGLTPGMIKMIGEIAANILARNIKITQKNMTGLFKHKALIRKLASGELTSAERHKVIKNNTGKVLSILGIALKSL
jgi:hypothetical protein